MLPRTLSFPHCSVGKESTCNAGDPSSIPGSGRSAGEGIGYPLQYSWASKESIHNVGDLGLIPELGRSPGEGKGYPLQYSGLENSMDCIVHGVTKTQTQLNDFHFHFCSVHRTVIGRLKHLINICGMGQWVNVQNSMSSSWFTYSVMFWVGVSNRKQQMTKIYLKLF